MRYFLRRKEDGKYVAKYGSENSYTSKIQDARIFSEAELEREKCGNEYAVLFSQVFGGLS